MVSDVGLTLEMQFFIPFLFVLAVVFGVLQLVNIFKNKAVNAVISLAIAFFAASNSVFVATLNAQLGNITTFFIIMFFIAFVMELFGFRGRGKDYTESLVLQGGILFVLLAIGFMFQDQIPTLPLIGGGTNLILLIAVILILAIFWAAFKIGVGAIPSHREK